MQKGNYIDAILRAKKTVFTFKEIALLWREAGTNTTRVRINYYIKKEKLLSLRRGIYVKDKDYNKLELATKIITPAYVSFETVLAKEGIVFQYYDRIFVASYLTRDIVCDSQVYSFKKIKRLILTNNIGVENKEECSVATKERAFLDTLYINKDYYFDNLVPLDWDKVFAILPIYQNQRMNKKVKELYDTK
ncbi:MAG: hypothetical protein A2X78_02795 [Gammaproteobacteria bacterium GWE2_37_16]|nr:MAG: hypothetical protein A2X78_02795 [Gammaproteobacteria bacterium GWE2_37_16]